MENKDITFNGITYNQFADAAQTVASYFNGIANAPLTSENEIVLLICGLHGMMINQAYNRYIEKLQELELALEARRAANEENIASQHIKN